MPPTQGPGAGESLRRHSARLATQARAGVQSALRSARRIGPFARRRAVALALAAVLLLGLAARWQASGWGLPYLSHWDEPFVANRALEILRTGDFNPRFFNYGSLVLYLDVAVDAIHYYRLVGLPDEDPQHLRSPQDIRFHGASEDSLSTAPDREPYWVSHPSFYLWNRRLTALFGAAAIALCFHLARSLWGATAGLVAASRDAIDLP